MDETFDRAIISAHYLQPLYWFDTSRNHLDDYGQPTGEKCLITYRSILCGNFSKPLSSLSFSVQRKRKISVMTENILSLNSPTESYCVVYEQMQNMSNSHEFVMNPQSRCHPHAPLEPPPSGPGSERYRRLETSARRARQLQRPYTPTWMESRVYVYQTACGARAKERYGQICPSPLDFLTIFRKYGRLRVPLA